MIQRKKRMRTPNQLPVVCKMKVIINSVAIPRFAAFLTRVSSDQGLVPILSPTGTKLNDPKKEEGGPCQVQEDNDTDRSSHGCF